MYKRRVSILLIVFILLDVFASPLQFFKLISEVEASTQKVKVTIVSNHNPGYYWCQRTNGTWMTNSTIDGPRDGVRNVNGQPEKTWVKTEAPISAPTNSTHKWEDSNGNKYEGNKVKDPKPVVGSARMAFNADKNIEGKPYVQNGKVIMEGFSGNGIRGGPQDVCGSNPGYVYPFPLTVTWEGYVDAPATPPQPTLRLRVTPNESSIKVGESVTLKLEAEWSNQPGIWHTVGNNRVAWSSNKVGDASIDTSGRVVGKRDTGTNFVTITGTFTEHKQSATARVYVYNKEPKITNLEVRPNEHSMGVNQERDYKAYALFDNGSERDVTTSSNWSIMNGLVASVNNSTLKGRVKGLQVGTTLVQASYQGKTGSARVNVVRNPPPPPDPPPSDPPPANEPPVAIIDGATLIKAGDPIFLSGTRSFDPDGTIKNYYWGTPSATNPISGSSGVTYYMNEGNYNVSLSVEDDKGAFGFTNHSINVLPPTPVADMRIGGTLKENRLVTLTSTSRSPEKFPIDWNQSYWEIRAKSTANRDAIRFRGTLINQQIIESLFKKAGEYEIDLYVKNTAGYSSRYSEERGAPYTITIVEDLPPVADFSTVTTIYRDPDNENKATIKLTDLSYSEDDVIGQRIWSYRFDSNNDGSFENEQKIIIDNSNMEELSFEASHVGKYLIELEIKESFGQPTIPEFVTDADYLRAKTKNKSQELSIVHVNNLAPMAGFDLGKKKTVDLQVEVNDSRFSKQQIESEINIQLAPMLAQHNIGLKLEVNEMKKTGDFHGKIASGFNHNVFVIEDGVYGIGENNHGQLGVASPNNASTFIKAPNTPKNIVSADAGEYYTVILDGNGEIYISGKIWWGISGTNTSFNKVNVPFKVKKVSAGKNHVVLLAENGDVYTIGYNKYNQVGNTTVARETYTSTPVKMNGISNVVDITAGNDNTFMKTSDGKIWGIGLNHWSGGGVIRPEQVEFYSSPVEVSRVSTAKSMVTSGWSTTYVGSPEVHHNNSIIFLQDDGSFSGNVYGRGEIPSVPEPIKQAALGRGHAILLTNTGKVYGFGDNLYSQIGPGPSSYSTPTIIEGLSDVVYVSANNFSSIYVLRDGTIKYTGGWPATSIATTPTVLDIPKVEPTTNFRESNHMLFTSIITDKQFKPDVAGKSVKGVFSSFIGLGTSTTKADLEKILQENGYRGTYIDNSNLQQSVAKMVDYILEEVLATKMIEIQMDITNSPYSQDVLRTKINQIMRPLFAENKINAHMSWFTSKGIDPKSIAAGRITSYFMTEKEVYAVGSNSSFQLGDGTNTDRNRPVKVQGVSDVIAIAPSSQHSLFLTSSGEVFAVGNNGWGQLGDGTNTNRNTPVKVQGVSNVVAIAAGMSHSLFLTSSGDVFAVGRNVFWQLGDGTSTDRNRPVKVQGVSDVIAIAAGSEHSLFLTSSGEVFAVGNNNSGQLGDGTWSNRNIPVKVLGLPSNVIDIVSSDSAHHSFVLTKEKEVYGFGSNIYGELSDGTTQSRNRAVKVQGVTGVTDVAVGQYFSLFLTESKEVFGVGYNHVGQLGLGNTTNWFATPQKTNVSNVAGIKAGSQHSIFALESGDVLAVGNNGSGQLGDGTNTNRNTPVKVTNLPKLRLGEPDAYFSSSKKILYTSVLSNKEINVTKVSEAIKDLSSTFIGLGTTANKNKLEEIITLNGGLGIYLDHTNIDITLNKLADYIIDDLKKTKVDLYYGVGDTVHNNIDALKSKVNQIVVPMLNAEGIEVNKNIIETLGTVWESGTWLQNPSSDFPSIYPGNLIQNLPNNRIFWVGSGQVPVIYNVNTNSYTRGQSIPLHLRNFVHGSSVVLPNGNILVAGGNYQSPYNGDIGSEFARIYNLASDTWQEAPNMSRGRKYANASLLKDGRVLVTGGEHYYDDARRETEVYNPISNTWSNTANMNEIRSRHSQVTLPDGRVLVTGGRYSQHQQPRSSAEIYNPSTNTWSIVSSMNFARSGHRSVLLPDGKVLVMGGRTTEEMEVYDPLSNTWLVINDLFNGYKRDGHIIDPIIGDLLPDGRIFVSGNGTWFYTPKFKAKLNLPTSSNLIASFLMDNSLNGQTKSDVLGNVLTKNGHLIGLGKSNNKTDFNQLINANMEKGIFIDNTNIDVALQKQAEYIIETIKNGTQHEIFITLDEETHYTTYYSDYENDPKYAERWRYNHNPGVFEHDLGMSSFHNHNLLNYITSFNKVGRYQVIHAARDNPVLQDHRFDWYRKWSTEVDNWFIYVHRKPVPDFSFTLNKVNGNISFTNRAYDLDKYSIDIGYGPGLRKMSYRHRIQGESVWKEGLPNKAYRVVLEVEQSVTDFQGATERITKVVNGLDANAAPVAKFEFTPPQNVRPNTEVTFINQSHDPDGDPLTFRWEFQQENSSTWTQFSTVEHPRRTFAGGKYTIRLTVTDPSGSSDSATRELIVIPFGPPIADFDFNPKTNIYQNTTVNFHNLSRDPEDMPLTYQWHKRRSGTTTWTLVSTEEHPNDKFTPTGNWDVRLTVRNPVTNLTATQTKTLTVLAYQPPIADFEFHPATGAKVITPIEFTNRSRDPHGGNLTYQWRKRVKGTTTWTNFSTLENPTELFNDPRDWEVELRATSSVSGLTGTVIKTVPITPFAPPIASFQISPTVGVYPDTMVTLTNYSIDPQGHSLTYRWERRQGTNPWVLFSTVRNPETTFDPHGTWEIRLTVTSTVSGLTGTQTKTLSVQPYLPPIADFTYNPLVDINTETLVGFTNQSSDPQNFVLSYQWTKRKQGTSTWIPFSTATHPSQVFDEATTWEVRLIATNEKGLSDTVIKSFLVVPANEPPVAGFEIIREQHYIGEKVQVRNTTTDPDDDYLSIVYHLYHVNGASKVLKETKTYTNVAPPYNFTFEFDFILDSTMGHFEIEQIVNDGIEEDRITKMFTVLDLSIIGKVLHNEDWQKIHDRMGNLPHQFYSGEVFILEAIPANYPVKNLIVTMVGTQESGASYIRTISLNRVNGTLYTGEWFDESLIEGQTRLKKGSSVSFTFTVTYDNVAEIVREDVQTVEILGSVHDVMQFRRTH